MIQIKQQRDNNITVWISRKYHKRIKKIAFDMGVSITWVLNKAIEGYLEKGDKK